jgi:hypothetical protein
MYYRHRHIVCLYELFETAKCMWLILELVEGTGLRGKRTTVFQVINLLHLFSLLLSSTLLIIIVIIVIF